MALIFIFGGDYLAFYGLHFLFDDQYSKNYGLTIAAINGNSTTEASGGSNIEIFYDSVYRKPKKYIYGSSPEEVLTFEMEVVSEKPLYGLKRSKIQKWLFGRTKPCKLQIIQSDLQDIYFNCFLTDSSLIYLTNECYGFRFTVECDAPWAWQLPKTYTFRRPAEATRFTQKIHFYNDSDDTDYTYPLIEMQASSTLMNDGEVSIINHSDDGRTFSFTQLKKDEVVTVDNEIQLLSSSEGRLLSENFNKNFFRLLPGANELEINGEIQYLKITYSNARKVGG